MHTAFVPPAAPQLQSSPVESMEPVESAEHRPPTPLQCMASLESVASEPAAAARLPPTQPELWQQIPVNPNILHENIWPVMDRLLEPANRFLYSF